MKHLLRFVALLAFVAGNAECWADDADLSSATFDNPVKTNYVTNGTFDTNTEGWTTTTGHAMKIKSSSTSDYPGGSFNGNILEVWNNGNFTGKVYQTITNLPTGTYMLKMSAGASNLDSTAQFVYAGNDSTPLKSTTPSDYEVLTYVDNGSLEIGFNQTQPVTNWFYIDNVELYYCGTLNYPQLWQNTKSVKDATAENPEVTDFVKNGTFDSNIDSWSTTTGAQNNQCKDNQKGAFTGNFYENLNSAAL